jgi:glycosyltransferase involved in cell wall biosynthesis
VRILWVKAGKILPVDTGGKIRSYNLLKHLAARNELTLLSYYDGPRDQHYEAELKGQLPSITVNTGTPESTFGQTVNYLKHLPSTAPYAVTKFTSTKVRSLISEWDEQQRFDVLVCDFLSASLNFVPSLRTPVVLFQHNVESALWQRQAKHEANLLKRVAFKLEAGKMTKYERATVKRFAHVIAVSDHDRTLMSSMSAESRISVVPTGVDLGEYGELADTPAPRGDSPVVLFLGSMDWEANIDGVDFFCRDIWAQVKAAVPSARFCIVGRNPPPRITARASDSIIVTGRVDSVLPYLKEAAVFVVPLRIGGGTRLKIYEAMAAGKAVVSTSVGAEGLDVRHGKNILLADESESFAKSVIELLTNDDTRTRLGQNAARLAAQYDWAIISRRFEEILRQSVRVSSPQEITSDVAASSA